MGVKNGSRILTLAVKLHLEENPTHVALKLDKANAYNNMHRRYILGAALDRDGVPEPELAAYRLRAAQVAARLEGVELVPVLPRHVVDVAPAPLYRRAMHGARCLLPVEPLQRDVALGDGHC